MTRCPASPVSGGEGLLAAVHGGACDALLPQYAPAFALERALGDPALAANTLSSRVAMALDEADAFPVAAMALLQRLELPSAYVPRPLGGRFDSCEATMALGRVIARRDMTVAVSSSTMIWSTLAWIGASAAQQRQVARWMMEDGSHPCLAYSEADHGADLAANTLRAQRAHGGEAYVLDGEKWPINRATRSGFALLLARTGETPGLRSQSLFLIDKGALPDGASHHLPRVPTHGLRGCDISGIGFRGAVVPASACIGGEGQGLELALKGLQLSRTLCASLSLGVGDTALRLAADFAAERQLYGTHADRLPHVRDLLANAYLSQLMAECVAVVAARGLHLHPSQFSTWSCVAKLQASALVDEATRHLAGVLGARHYLREGHGGGLFQKFLRDGAVVALFDGSSAVCLDALATQLPLLVRSRRRAGVPGRAELAALFDLRQPLPPLRFDALDVSGRGRDAVLEGLPLLIDALDELPAAGDAAVRQALRRGAAAVAARLADLDEAVLGEAPAGRFNSARRFGLAQRLAELHTAVAALGLWLHNRAALGGFFADGQWLLAVLERAGAARIALGQLPADAADALCVQLDQQRRTRRMFSLLTWPLADAGARESHQPAFQEVPP